MLDRLKEDFRLVDAIRWKSTDKDNMEFTADITCFQKDALNRILQQARAGIVTI